MTALFAILCVAFAVYAYQQQETAHRALIGSYPPEYRDGSLERFVLWGAGFDPLTPLPVQAKYLNSIWAGTVAMLFFSLAFFSSGERRGGWLAMAIFLVGVVSTIRSWRTYKENCNKKAVSEQEGS